MKFLIYQEFFLRKFNLKLEKNTSERMGPSQTENDAEMENEEKKLTEPTAT